MVSPFAAFEVHSSGMKVVSILSSVGGSAAKTQTATANNENQTFNNCMVTEYCVYFTRMKNGTVQHVTDMGDAD